MQPKRIRLRVGDILQIPLPDGRRAYGQYVYHDDKMGPLLQVFDLITTETAQVAQLEGAGHLFPPVITGLRAAVRTGLWTIIGHTDVKDFVYPNFVSTFYDERTGRARLWFLWNGERSTQIGYELPSEYKHLEYLAVWSPLDVADRIVTGEYPYPYGDLIQNNRFEPRHPEQPIE